MTEEKKKKKKVAPSALYEMTALPCPRCLPLARNGDLRMEWVQKLPKGAFAPLARPPASGPCCYDCAAADTVVRLALAPDFLMARIAVGNDRSEQYRLEGFPLGLVAQGIVQPSEKGDFDKQLKWLDENQWFGEEGHEG